MPENLSRDPEELERRPVLQRAKEWCGSTWTKLTTTESEGGLLRDDWKEQVKKPLTLKEFQDANSAAIKFLTDGAKDFITSDRPNAAEEFGGAVVGATNFFLEGVRSLVKDPSWSKQSEKEGK